MFPNARNQGDGRNATLRRSAVLIIALTFCSIAAVSQTITVTLPTGKGPEDVALDPVTNRIYVVNTQDNTLTAIDGATNVTSTVSVGSQTGFAFPRIAVNTATSKIYVANPGDNTVTAIDETTLATTPIALSATPVAVAVDSTLNQIYVLSAASGSNESVIIIDGSSNTATSVDLGLMRGSSAIGVNPANHMVYVADDDTDGDIGHVATINGQTKQVVGITAVGTFTGHGVAVNPVSELFYVGNEDGDMCCSGPSTISVLDANSAALIATVDLAQCCSAAVVLVNPITNKIYGFDFGGLEEIDGASNAVRNISPLVGSRAALDATNNQIFFFEGTSLLVIDPVSGSTTTLAVGNGANSIAVNPVTHKAYLTNNTLNTVIVVDGATNVPARVAADLNPAAAAVNAVTGKAYIANAGGATVTEIDGENKNTTLNIPVGTTPVAVAINQVTNSIYVANKDSNNVTVIDGATHNTSTVTVGTNPVAIAVNSATSQTYVGNKGSNSVTVIDGANNVMATVAAGTNPVAVAVNPANNKIYVANQGSNNVTIIDGATNATSTVAAGDSPFAIVVNPGTNNAYVANGDSNVIVIDGFGNVAATVPVGAGPVSLAVNTLINKIYVANQADNSVTVIDGVTNSTTTIPAGNAPLAVAVNASSNKIYAINGDNNVIVIDGVTSTTSTVPVGTGAVALAINPVANKVYVANALSDDVTVIPEQPVEAVPLTTTITPTSFTGIASPISNPMFNLSATSAYFPVNPTPQHAYFQVDGTQASWTMASAVAGPGSNFTAQLPSLPLGDHVLYAFAVDGQDATAVAQVETIVGQIAGYPFTVVSATAPSPQLIVTSSKTSATVTAGASATYTLDVSAQGTLPSAVTFACSGLPALATCTFNPSSVNATATATPVTVTISTVAPSSALARNSGYSIGGFSATALLVPAWVFCAPFRTRRKAKRNAARVAMSILAALLMISLLGCSGGTSSRPPAQGTSGTPLGTFNIVITSTAGSLQTQTALTLTVQ